MILNAICIFGLSSILLGAEQNVMTYKEAGDKWREVTDVKLFPPYFREVKVFIEYNNAIVSYFRDGPGIFNVAPDAPNAALDRIYYSSAKITGFEVLDHENALLGLILSSGDRDQVMWASVYSRGIYAIRIGHGSSVIIEFLKSKNDPKAVEYYSAGLRLTKHKIQDYINFRIQTENEIYQAVSPRSYTEQIKLINNHVNNIDQFLNGIAQQDDAPEPASPAR